MGFQFGDILIPFKSSVEAAVKGIKSLENALNELVKASKRVDDAVNGIETDKNGNKFKALERNTLRAIDRLALLVVMSRTVKTALDTMFGAASNVSNAFTSMAEGFLVASSLAQLAKDNFGLAAAGIVGLASAIMLFVANMVQARIKAQEAATEQSIKAEKVFVAFKNTMKDAREAGEAFNDTYGEKMASALSLSRSAFEDAQKQLRDLALERKKLQDELDKLNERAASAKAQATTDGKPVHPYNTFGGELVKAVIAPDPEVVKAAEAAIQSVDRSIEALNTRMKDIVAEANVLKLSAQLGKFSTELQTLQLQLNSQRGVASDLERLAASMQGSAGFGENRLEEQKIANASNELRLRTQIYETAARDLNARKEILFVMKQLSNPTEEQKKQIEQLEVVVKHAQETLTGLASGAMTAGEDLRKALAGREFTQAFTIPFTNAIGDAVTQGILQGKKGMEILADISHNLLSAALNDVMKRFQQGMIDVFKAVAGAGGELLGAALITVVGVVAGVLGRRASSTDTFDKIKNQIESTQAVRGIVAGPANVAIAAVGDNLRRALVGVEQRLDVLIQVSLQIRDRAGGLPFAGSVAA